MYLSTRGGPTPMLMAGFVVIATGKSGYLQNVNVVIKGMKPAGRECRGKGCFYTFMNLFYFESLKPGHGFSPGLVGFPHMWVVLQGGGLKIKNRLGWRTRA